MRRSLLLLGFAAWAASSGCVTRHSGMTLPTGEYLVKQPAPQPQPLPVPPPEKDSIKYIARMLVAEYQNAARNGDSDLAGKYARMALDLDPMCFSPNPGQKEKPSLISRWFKSERKQLDPPTHYLNHPPQYFPANQPFPLARELENMPPPPPPGQPWVHPAGVLPPPSMPSQPGVGPLSPPAIPLGAPATPRMTGTIPPSGVLPSLPPTIPNQPGARSLTPPTMPYRVPVAPSGTISPPSFDPTIPPPRMAPPRPPVLPTAPTRAKRTMPMADEETPKPKEAPQSSNTPAIPAGLVAEPTRCRSCEANVERRSLGQRILEALPIPILTNEYSSDPTIRLQQLTEPPPPRPVTSSKPVRPSTQSRGLRERLLEALPMQIVLEIRLANSKESAADPVSRIERGPIIETPSHLTPDRVHGSIQ